MKFSVISGHPTNEELLALQAVLANYISVEKKSVKKRSTFALPQLRQPLQEQISFGSRKSD